ncbi:MAG: hypothetical protein AAGJ56_10015 [Myxococcota bacterium]
MCSRIIASANRGTTSHATRSITSRATLLTASALTPVSRAAFRTAAIDSGLLPLRVDPGFALSSFATVFATTGAGVDGIGVADTDAGALGTEGAVGREDEGADVVGAAGAEPARVLGPGWVAGLVSGAGKPALTDGALGAGGSGDRVGAALGIGVGADEAAAGPSAAKGSSKPLESLRSGSLGIEPKP